MIARLVNPIPVAVLPDLWGWLHERPDANFDDSGPDTFDAFAGYMARRIADEWTWAAFIQDVPVGAFGVKRTGPDRASWNGICVREASHGLGIATDVVGRILSELREHGIVAVDAFMFADNGPIRRVFERCGAEQRPCDRRTTRRGAALDVVRYEMQVGG